MDTVASNRIKQYLERLFDIPFDVSGDVHFGDYWFDIKPQNLERELFEIKIRFKNHIRLIVEVNPEKYAAFSVNDMAMAGEEKKIVFSQYASELKKRKAHVEFYINGIPNNPEEPKSWPLKWTGYRMRVSRSPIAPEDKEIDQIEVAESWARIIAGMFLSLLNMKLLDENDYPEGGVKRIEVNRYERNPVNRELCLEANGYSCSICGFDFEKVYGDIGRHYIHVHHIIPVSKMDKEYMINPVNDMIPVCPNCHAMLHRVDPPLLPEKLRIMMDIRKKS